MLHTEGHVRRLRFNFEFAKESSEIRVGYTIEDHESRVDRHCAPVFLDRDRIGVAASESVLFV